MASRERAIINNLNERARFYGRPPDELLTIEDVRAVMAFYDYSSCLSGTRPATSIDHVIPLAQNGTNTRNNLQLLTIQENKEKGDNPTDYRNGRICPDDFQAPQLTEKTREYKRHDWETIEKEYITSNIPTTTRELATKFDVPYPTLRDYSIRHEWDKRRKELRSRIVAESHDDVVEQLKQPLVKHELSARATLFQVIDQAVEEWNEKPRATLGDLATLLKLGLAAQGETTERTANVEEDDYSDNDIIEAAQHVARRADRKAADGDYRYSAPDEDGPGAGWSD